MPFKRLLMNQPPTEVDMDSWEESGFTNIQIVGPVVGRQEGDEPGQERVVFVVYLYRTVFDASELPRALRGAN